MGTKVLSTRLSEEAHRELEAASRRLGKTKRAFLEEAIRERARRASDDDSDAFVRAIKESFGVIRSDEPVEQMISRIRAESEQEYERHWRSTE